MSLFQAIVLAVVQGLTEFLPISSTAHLILVPWLLGWQDPGLAYDVALHAGTLVAVLAYFARDWMRMARAWLFRSATTAQAADRRLFGWIVAATLPAALAGYFLESYAESVFRQPALVAAALIGVALLMWVADRRRTLVRKMETVGFADAALIGAAQAVGIIGGATLLEGWQMLEQGLPPGTSARDFIVGLVVSGLVGYAAIAFLLRYLQMKTLKIFVAYRLALGAIILLIEFLRSAG